MRRRCGLVALAAVLAGPAFAGRPLTTEDASVLDDKRCQVEAWVDRSREASQAWLVPACNFGAGIEWQAGAARERESGASRLSETYAQAKFLLRPLEGDAAWGAGVVAGVVRRPVNERFRGWDHPYVTLPLSIAIGDARVHVNAGWARDREAGRHLATWGLAAEAPLLPQITGVAEAFGQNSERPFLRAGARMTLVKDSLDLDLTLVTRPGGTRAERFVSLGVFWQSGRILP